MKTVSLKIDDTIFGETEKIRSQTKIPRNRYMNEALDYYNQVQRRRLLEKVLQSDSELVRDESMKVLRDFENIEDAG